jgi:ParB-like chromosome segregation protein Spo0J
MQIETIELTKLIPRPTNPNEMTNERFENLTYSVENIGYVQPIIVNQDNKIVDGNHRYKALLQSGKKEIDVVRIQTKDDTELKLISQTMNKLRGKHNTKKDIEELTELLGYAPAELNQLLSFGEDDLDLLRQQAAEEDQLLADMLGNENLEETEQRDAEEIDRKSDLNPVERYAESYLHGNIKQISILFKNEEFNDIIQKMQMFMALEQIDNHTDLFKILLEVYDTYVYKPRLRKTTDN